MKINKVDYYLADVVSATDYYPFGSIMPGRVHTPPVDDQYRFAFNGMEDDSKGLSDVDGAQYTTHFRMLDTRLGRWWSTDPVIHPWQSPYNTFDNNPIVIMDPSGADGETTNHEDGSTTYSGEVMDKDGGTHVVDGWTNSQMQSKGYTTLGGTGTQDGGYQQAMDDRGIPNTYNANSGYKYNAKDLIVRDALQAVGGFKRMINNWEKNGNAKPLSRDNYWKSVGGYNENTEQALRLGMFADTWGKIGLNYALAGSTPGVSGGGVPTPRGSNIFNMSGNQAVNTINQIELSANISRRFGVNNNINIWGEAEALGFTDVATNSYFANGRVLSGGIPSSSASRIVLNNSPITEVEIAEINRLAHSGTILRVSGSPHMNFSNLTSGISHRSTIIFEGTYTGTSQAGTSQEMKYIIYKFNK